MRLLIIVALIVTLVGLSSLTRVGYHAGSGIEYNWIDDGTIGNANTFNGVMTIDELEAVLKKPLAIRETE